MEILYQKYYEQDTSNENNYSVCLLITHTGEQQLFIYRRFRGQR